MVSLLMAVGAAVVLLAFLLAPLLRGEDDLKPIRRPRPGTRHLHGLESVNVEPVDPDRRRCPHCGTPVDAEFDFCGECCKPLP